VHWQRTGLRSTRRGGLSMRNSFVQHVPVLRDAAGWVRKFGCHKKLKDEVENVHGSLSWSDKAEEYFRLLDATHDSQAVEGSIAADDFAAARMLRAHARSIGNKVAEQNLTTIKRALSIVLSRYNLGGNSRRSNTSFRPVFIVIVTI
jgi:hypothetical protein